MRRACQHARAGGRARGRAMVTPLAWGASLRAGARASLRGRVYSHLVGDVEVEVLAAAHVAGAELGRELLDGMRALPRAQRRLGAELEVFREVRRAELLGQLRASRWTAGEIVRWCVCVSIDPARAIARRRVSERCATQRDHAAVPRVRASRRAGRRARARSGVSALARASAWSSAGSSARTLSTSMASTCSHVTPTTCV